MAAGRKNVLHLLDERTKRYGERIALGTKTQLGWKEFTYKGIGLLSRKLGSYLIDDLGVKKATGSRFCQNLNLNTAPAFLPLP